MMFKQKIKRIINTTESRIKYIYYNHKQRTKLKKYHFTEDCRKLTKKEKEEISTFYATYGLKKVDTGWHRLYYCCTGHFSPKYVPENIYYLQLEPKLNKYEFAPALSDKNVLDKLFPSVKQPEVVVKNINGLFFSREGMIGRDAAMERCNQAGEMVIKPTVDTWGGNKIVVFSCQRGITSHENKTIEELLADYGQNFVVQKYVQQHPEMSRLNSASLNTFRIMSYLKDGVVTILSIVVRMGVAGSPTDNVSTGGIACGVSLEGHMNEYGFKFNGEKALKTSEGMELKGIRFSFMDKVIETVHKLHRNAPYFRIVSWDLSIDHLGEVVFVEYNIKGMGINLHQLNNGPVLAVLLDELR
ncbi:MAG TPA: sugar-transfer associated ATP-grasp domain-containing protein [Eudoraea sp.]|nr:sugar-transfer associated ATP-grasp domain-containing protein [Eudoraea sp.]